MIHGADQYIICKIAENPKVVSVFLNRGRKLQTTHSWEFMLQEVNNKVIPNSLWNKARFGEDTIIANLDTGIKLSFSDLHFCFFFLIFCFLYSSCLPATVNGGPQPLNMYINALIGSNLFSYINVAIFFSIKINGLGSFML